MNEQEKKNLIKYFILPFIGFMALYYLVMQYIVADYEFSLKTAAKYSLSFMTAKSEIAIPVNVDVPDIYQKIILENDLPVSGIPLKDFHLFLEFVHGGVCWTYLCIIPAAVIAMGIGLFLYLDNRIDHDKKYKQQNYIRGTKKISGRELCRRSQKNNEPGIVLDTHSGLLILSKKKQKEHYLILGSTGSGKSTLLLMMTKNFISSGTRMIILDRKGEFYSYFGRKDDILFNPFDQRSVGWSVFNEIRFELSDGRIHDVPPDLKVISELIFGVSAASSDKGNDRYWYQAAAGVFCSAVCWCVLHKKTTMADLVLFLQRPADELIRKFKSLPEGMQSGLQYLGEKAGERANSIVSILAPVTRQLECFANKDGDFSVRQWLHEGKGNLYLSTAGRNDTVYMNIIQLLIDLVGREIKEFPDNGHQETKLVFMIDELGALPPLQTLSFLLTQARSKGICCILANQTFEKLRAVYGDHEARNIIACSKTRFFFQIPEPTDAEFLSKAIGSSEVERMTMNRNENYSGVLSVHAGRRGKSYNKSIVQDVAFMPAELAALQTGHAVAVIPELLPSVSEVFFKIQELRARNSEYEPVAVTEVSSKVAAYYLQDVEEVF